jgi:nucleoside-diphosphate-sugar epimerase
MASTVAVTGANGFVGSTLVGVLADRGHLVRALVRRAESVPVSSGVQTHVLGDLRDERALSQALEGADAVIHLAARAHVMDETAADPDAAFREANVAVTDVVARVAEQAGVRRLVYLSSIKVNGERTTDRPFRATDPPAPQDAYARSKLEAEELLRRHAGTLRVCIVRPPLVYGPGVKGNMLRLIRLVWRGVPLPFGSIRNRRSIVSVTNLSSFLERCASDERADGQTFLMADAAPLSTADMIRHIAAGLGRPARLLPVPAHALKLAAAVTRRAAEIDRLIGSMELDPADSFARLDWQPPVSTADGLRAMGGWYAAERAQAD